MKRSRLQDLEISYGGERVFTLADGYNARLRCTPDNDHWIGTVTRPLALGWSPNYLPVTKVDSVDTSILAHGFDVVIHGTKPDLMDAPVTTTISATLDANAAIRYTISSRLKIPSNASVKLLRDEGTVEYLDPWFEGIFWPSRDGHDRELYDTIVYGMPDGTLVRAPKLHIFPSFKSAPYETLKRALSPGSSVALVDKYEPGYLLRVKSLTGDGRMQFCWWTWDLHMQLRVPDSVRDISFEVEISALPPADAQALVEKAREIPFREAPDYQLPVFHRDEPNTFCDMLERPDQWAWEPHSADCRIDRSVGFNDTCSLTIKSETNNRTGWYSRALGVDYFDHRELRGLHRVSAMIRTSDVKSGARLGVFCHDGAESWLYGEPAYVAHWSDRVRDTRDWTAVAVVFDATGHRRIKIVLEQLGEGQTWFDNVEFAPVIDQIAGRKKQQTPLDRQEPLDWRDMATDPEPRQLDFSQFETSREEMHGEGRLVMAWLNCSARTPRVVLPTGRYQMRIRASADGCPDDPPILNITIPDIIETSLSIMAGATMDYEAEFELDEVRAVQADLLFANDGECSTGSRRIDKNVYLDSFELVRVSRGGQPDAPDAATDVSDKPVRQASATPMDGPSRDLNHPEK